MPQQRINLTDLMRVVGEPPPRYRKGDPRNRARSAWYARARAALKVLLKWSRASNLEHSNGEKPLRCPSLDSNHRAAAMRATRQERNTAMTRGGA
jgi:hypothetical protein